MKDEIQVIGDTIYYEGYPVAAINPWPASYGVPPSTFAAFEQYITTAYDRGYDAGYAAGRESTEWKVWNDVGQ